MEYTGGSEHRVTCLYCGISVAVPEEFWREAEEKQTLNKWGKYLIIFLVIVVGIPTCLGLIGTILGIGGSLIGIVIGFLGPIFAALVKLFIH